MMVREGSAAAQPPAFPSRHPEDGLLVAYAAGSLAEPSALLVATHLALCPHCRGEVGEFEAVGGALLDEAEPAEVTEAALTQTLAALDVPAAMLPRPVVVKSKPSTDRVPQPLRDYIGTSLADLKWRLLLPGVRDYALQAGDPSARLGLLKISAGSGIPRHTHHGGEFVLVLAGSFADSTGDYHRGDFAFADDALTHRPVAGMEDDCICLTLSEGPMRFTGPLARWLNLLQR